MAGKSSGTKAMWIALAGYTVLFAGKLAAYFVTNLGVMFAEAMHSLADMLIAAFLLVAAYWSRKPADADYRFGYGRAQNIAALVAATIFISFTSLETLREAIPKFFQPAEETGSYGIALIVILISIVISALPLIQLLRTKQRSAAERAQFIECINDEVALVAALVGTILVSRGFPLADPIASTAVAIIIAVNAAILWRENAATLMGHSPDSAFFEKVKRIALSTPGVRSSHNSIAEQVGEQIHLGIHVEVDPTLDIVKADAIGDEVRTRLESEFADIWVAVHVDPERGEDVPDRGDVGAVSA